MDYRPKCLRTPLSVVLFMCAAPVFAQNVSQAPTRVIVQSLGQVEPFKVGANTAIPFTMSPLQWRGTSAQSASRLMSDLPEAGSSPLLNQLAASVLISPSAPPAGGQGNVELASLRLASAYRLGLLDAVINLAERSPGGLSDPENAAIATRAFLALGQDDKACETALRLQNGRDAVFWLKVRAYCLARQGRTGAAELTADLVLEADPDDIDFMLALNRMLNKDSTQAAPINALELAMARFAGAPITLDQAPLSLKSAMAKTQSPVGLDAARQIAALGLMRPGTLSDLYLAWPGLPAPKVDQASDEEIQGPQPAQSPAQNDASLLVIALAQDGAARPALLYQSAHYASTAQGLANAIFEGLRYEKELGGFIASAQLYAPLLEKLSTDQLALNDAMRLYFMYALIAADRSNTAQQYALSDDATSQRLFAIQPGAGKTLNEAWDTQSELQGPNADLIYSDLVALLALGAQLNDDQRNFLFNHIIDSQEFSPCRAGARAAILDGARHGARGPSFLRAALMLAESGFDRVAPQCGAAVISAFREMGYQGLAKKAAREMMLAPRLHHLRRLNE